jgi:hypothetical protein
MSYFRSGKLLIPDFAVQMSLEQFLKAAAGKWVPDSKANHAMRIFHRSAESD